MHGTIGLRSLLDNDLELEFDAFSIGIVFCPLSTCQQSETNILDSLFPPAQTL